MLYGTSYMTRVALCVVALTQTSAKLKCEVVRVVHMSLYGG